MRCPICQHEDTKVLESRISNEGKAMRRRRSCLACNYRFTTYEKEEELNIQVKKKDGRYESFSRDKLFRSIQIACQKRPVPIDAIDRIINRIEIKIQESGERIIPSEVLGDLTMHLLKDTDHIAYVRFASVYKNFKDVGEFVNETNSLKLI